MIRVTGRIRCSTGDREAWRILDVSAIEQRARRRDDACARDAIA
jgi:hypothetical protein